jgi:hypothetical protein
LLWRRKAEGCIGCLGATRAYTTAGWVAVAAEAFVFARLEADLAAYLATKSVSLSRQQLMEIYNEPGPTKALGHDIPYNARRGRHDVDVQMVVVGWSSRRGD